MVLGSKLTDYAQLKIPDYLVYDPLQKLGATLLQVFPIQGSSYIPKNQAWFPEVNLGLTLGNGLFENINATWLRWCDANGNVIETGDELVAKKDVQIKQALLLAIEMGLKFRFGDEALGILSDISAINDVKLLSAIASQIPNISSTDELRKLYTK